MAKKPKNLNPQQSKILEVKLFFLFFFNFLLLIPRRRSSKVFHCVRSRAFLCHRDPASSFISLTQRFCGLPALRKFLASIALTCFSISLHLLYGHMPIFEATTNELQKTTNNYKRHKNISLPHILKFPMAKIAKLAHP